jgi:hypothetical protein
MRAITAESPPLSSLLSRAGMFPPTCLSLGGHPLGQQLQPRNVRRRTRSPGVWQPSRIWTLRAGPSDADAVKKQLGSRSGGPCVGDAIAVLLG